MKEKLKKIKEDEKKLRDKKLAFKKEFEKWVFSHPNWRTLVCNKIIENNSRSKYEYTKEYVYENMIDSIKDIDSSFSGEEVCFSILLEGDHDRYVSTGYFKLEEFENIEVDPTDIQDRIKRKEDRIELFREDIRDAERSIKEEEKEIENLKSWI